jgi:predicted small metal-binding protein
MARKFIDCREFPSESKCSVTIAADSEKELMEVAVQHAVSVHGHEDTPAFRQQLREAIRDGAPPA